MVQVGELSVHHQQPNELLQNGWEEKLRVGKKKWDVHRAPSNIFIVLFFDPVFAICHDWTYSQVI